MGTTLVLSKKPVCSSCLTWEEHTAQDRDTICTVIFSLLYNCCIFIWVGDFFFLVSILMTYQSFKIVTCPEISEIQTIWQEMNKISNKESPSNKQKKKPKNKKTEQRQKKKKTLCL